MMNLVAQEFGPQRAPTASRSLKGHPERFWVVCACEAHKKAPHNGEADVALLAGVNLPGVRHAV